MDTNRSQMSPAVRAQIEKNKAAAGVSAPAPEPEFKPVPGFPALEVSRDFRVRRVEMVTPREGGLVQAQDDGRKLMASVKTLHKAVWPDMWPEPERAVELSITEPPWDIYDVARFWGPGGVMGSPALHMTRAAALALYRRMG